MTNTYSTPSIDWIEIAYVTLMFSLLIGPPLFIYLSGYPDMAILSSIWALGGIYLGRSS